VHQAHAQQPAPDIDDWDRHWDDYSSAAADNPAQRYRRRIALHLVGRRGAPARLVDVGSGQGDLLADAAARWPGAELLGLEVSERGIRESERKVPGARFLLRDLLSEPDVPAELAGWGTHAVCSEVLEHVDDPVRLLRGALGYLAPGCRLVVTVPGGPMSAFDRHIGHRRHFTPESLADVLRAAGLDVLLATGAGFPFFNIYRALVIARGERLIDDVSAREGEAPSAAARAAMLAFRPLFRLNLPRSPWGTQIVAAAQLPR
jgi:SAM-dependent methyltransferase